MKLLEAKPQRLLAVIAFLLLSGPVVPAQSTASPGLVFPWAPAVSVYVAPMANVQEKRDTRLLIAPRQVGRNLATGNDAEPMMIDFATGRPSEVRYADFLNTPMQADGDGYKGVITGKDGFRLAAYYAHWREAPAIVGIGTRKLRLNSREVQLSPWGMPFSFRDALPYFDRRAKLRPYSAFVCDDAFTAKVLWSKVYLVQTQGRYRGPRPGDFGATNIVESPHQVFQWMDGDPNFYVRNLTDDGFAFGNVVFRVDLRTGELPANHRYIKAIDKKDFEALLHRVEGEIESAYGRPADANAEPQFRGSVGRRTNGFRWSGDYWVDVPALLNLRIQQTWF